MGDWRRPSAVPSSAALPMCFPVLLRIAAFFRDESCGQCVPCRVGTVRQQEALLRLASERPRGGVEYEIAIGMRTGRGEAVIGGFEFDGIEPRDYYALADLMYGDADALGRFLASRCTHKDLFRGSAQFIRWGVTEPIRAVSYLLKGASPQAAAPSVAKAPAVQPAPAAVPETAAPEVASDAVAAPEPAVQATPPAVAAEADPAPAEPTPEAASGAAKPADWLNQLLDMAHWELRNAENANQAARELDHSDDQEAAKVSRAA